MLLNRSPTRDRLISWGLQTDILCLLCNSSNESRDHLYFECPFSRNHFATRLRITSSSNSWNDVTHSLMSLSGSRHHKYLSLLSWQATIYELWWERNERLHRGKYRSTDSLWKRFKSMIKNKISALRPENNTKASAILQLWFSLDGTS